MSRSSEEDSFEFFSSKICIKKTVALTYRTQWNELFYLKIDILKA